jgi:RNA recognition motif-containing protein
MANDTDTISAKTNSTSERTPAADRAPATERAASLTKVYVGSLPYDWTAENLEEMFKAYGRITSATVVADQLTRRSKGFGFVEYESADDAKKAIAELNGHSIEGRSLLVREARPHVERSNDRGSSNDRGNGSRQPRERQTILLDNAESTDTTGRSYGNRRGWW